MLLQHLVSATSLVLRKDKLGDVEQALGVYALLMSAVRALGKSSSLPIISLHDLIVVKLVWNGIPLLLCSGVSD